MTLTRRDTPHHTYGEYLTWPDDPRVELIDGVPYVKEPAPSPLHQDLVVELGYQIRTALEAKPWRMYVAPFDVRLPNADEPDEMIDTVVQPDILIIRDRYRIDGRGLRGAPDWLAEVLSPSTARHDQFVKLPAYERAGVREVWLIHPIDRTLSIYRLEAGHYGSPTIRELKGKTQITDFPGVSIDWDQMPDGLP